jgi:hypothetical protein
MATKGPNYLKEMFCPLYPVVKNMHLAGWINNKNMPI